jgi:hypothetical protein
MKANTKTIDPKRMIDAVTIKTHTEIMALSRKHGPVCNIFPGDADEADRRRKLGAYVRDWDDLAVKINDGHNDFYWGMIAGSICDLEAPIRMREYGCEVRTADGWHEAMLDRMGDDKITSHQAKAAWRCNAIMAWARSGFHAVRLTSMQAAAFAWSEETIDPATVKAPWPGFAIDVPVGLLSWVEEETIPASAGLNTSVTRIMVHDHTDDRDGRFITMIALGDRESGAELVGRPIQCTQAFTAFDGNDDPNKAEEQQRRWRLWNCVARIVLSTMISLSDPDRMAPVVVKKPGKGQKWRAHAQRGLDYVEVNQPVLVDAREVVTRYIATGQAGRIGVRVLVRGHHRNQPCGPKSSLRKRIWIDPFWRGDEEAPVIVHPHELTDAAANLQERLTS